MQTNHSTSSEPFNFGDIAIETFEYEDDLWVTGVDIGRALEYSNPSGAIYNLFQRNKAELEQYSRVLKLPIEDGFCVPNEEMHNHSEYASSHAYSQKVGGEEIMQHHSDVAWGHGTSKEGPHAEGIVRMRLVRVFNEEGIMVLTMLSQQPKAAAFRAWAAKVLKAYRHGKLALYGGSNPITQEKALMGVERVLSRMDRAKNGAIKAAYAPLLDWYCKKGGLEPMDHAAICPAGPDQLPLPGV